MQYLVTDRVTLEKSIDSLESIQQHGFKVIYSEEDVEVIEEEDRFYLFQGIISNRGELRRVVSTDADRDVELLQRCYEKEDFDHLKYVDGIYTVVIIEDSGLELIRDVFGSKPVYFTEEESFVLSSNIRPILKMRPELGEINKDVAADYLIDGLVDHRRETFYQGVKQLRPREKISYNGEKADIQEVRYLREGTYGLKESVLESIHRLKPEVSDYYCPVSGGLDSTITAMESGGADHIHLSFEQGTRDDYYISEVKSEYGLDTEKINVKPIEILEEVKSTIDTQEEPTAFPAVQAQSILYRSMEDDSIVISGTGADELFYGYSWFVPFYLAEKIRDVEPISFLREIINYRETLDLRHLYGIKDILFGDGAKLLGDGAGFVNADSSSIELKNLAGAREKHLKDFYVPHMLRSVQKNSEKHQVEVRPVFLSKKLFSISETWEHSEHFQNGLTKYPLRSVFKEELPEEIFLRGQKTGFISSDNSMYTSSTTKELQKVFRSESFQDRGLIKSEEILKSLENGSLPFELAYRFYNYEIWMRNQ